MDNQNNNTNNSINELSTSMPIQTTPVEGPPSPSQNIPNSVGTSVKPYEINQVQNQSQNNNIQSQTMVNLNTNSINTQSKNNNYLLNSDDLIRAYIGPNYEKILRRPFNFGAFFFTSFYYFYRKMNLYAIIIIILQGVVSYFLSSTPYAILIINLLCGLLTNKLYVNFSVRKISKILINNSDKSIFEVKGMCYVLGGRSISKIFILLLLIAPFLLIILLLILITGSLTSFEKFIKNIDFSNIKIPEIKLPNNEFKNEYEGYIISDKRNKILDIFNINTPNNFKPTSNNNEYLLNYEYKSNKKNLSTCSYEFTGVNGYSDSKTLINKMREYYKDKNPSDIKEEIINRIVWYGFNFKNDDGTNMYYYVCSKKNMVFLYLFVDEKNSSNLCHSYVKNIMNTISFK